jgi:hypothetical protein
MRLHNCLLAPVLAFVLVSSGPVFAQSAPPEPTDHASCQAEEASLEQEIALARSRGQMLRRRQLADALYAMQAHCAALVPPKDKAARIERQEQEVAHLRAELSRAEAYLAKLKASTP